MGIDIHGLNFLRHTKNKALFGDTITIGRQELLVIEPEVRALVGTKPGYKNQVYCEDVLIEYFGATKVESIDNSDFEQATHVHNMNEPLPENLRGKYDTVVDGGCLEHIFNAPQALKNCSLLCKPGGQIIHILPANNFCGHGFWQFSPELFFSLYSTKNGYKETEVFLADLRDTTKWYQVKEPQNGKRVNVTSSNELYALVRTVLRGPGFVHAGVQQSDYVHLWENASSSEANAGKGAKPAYKQKLKQIGFVYRLLSPVYHSYLRSRTETGLNAKNLGLKEITVKRIFNQGWNRLSQNDCEVPAKGYTREGGLL